LVANALVHRDLGPNTQSKRVEIRLRPDRLVISNPGGLWGVSREQLGKPGGKSAVNEYLYDVCTLMTTEAGTRIIEGEGGGSATAQRELGEWPTDPPIFVDKGVSFTTVLIRPGLGAEVPGPRRAGDVETRIFAVLDSGPLDRNTIAERCGLTFAQSRYALRKLVEHGRVTMNGGLGARNTTYSIVRED
jgi:ATP-dependent DNA helicase RecG